MNVLAQALISGLVIGSIYAVMTIGLTLVYGCLRTLNMAQGSFGMIGAYAAWLGFTKLGLDPWFGLVLAALAAAAVGILTHLVAVQPLLGHKDIDFEMTAYISTLVVAIILTNTAILVFGARNKAIPPLVEGRLHLFGSVGLDWHAVIMAGIAFASLAALSLFLSRTRHGLSILAVAQDLEAARLMGVKTSMVYLLTMALAGVVGGIAGVLLAPLYFVSPISGDLVLLKGLIVAIFAGLGSFKGTVYGALAIGLVESFVSAYIGAVWSLPILFALIVIVMIVRPYGLFGKPEEERL
jgi:branched-subunit amino acid ABC-type transport system permease component